MIGETAWRGRMLFINSVALVFMILLAIDETKDAFRQH